jgi:hypothetical protein
LNTNLKVEIVNKIKTEELCKENCSRCLDGTKENKYGSCLECSKGYFLDN